MGMIASLSFLLYGRKAFTKDGFNTAAKRFDNSIMSRSLAGKTVAVTGANQGLGYATAEALARRGATLLMLCRSRERGAAAQAALVAATGNQNIELEVVDVSSLASVKAFAERFNASQRPLHCLINNAGALLNERSKTAEGFDASFALNTLGTLALTLALKPALARAAPSTVVFVASGGMYTSKLNDDFEFAKMRTWDGARAYSEDKRRQVAAAEVLAEKWRPAGITVVSMHPGWAETEGIKTSIPGFYNTFKDNMRNLEEGVDTVVWLALQDPGKLESGAFYLDRTPQIKHLTLAGTSYTTAAAEAVTAKVAVLAGCNLE